MVSFSVEETREILSANMQTAYAALSKGRRLTPPLQGRVVKAAEAQTRRQVREEAWAEFCNDRANASRQRRRTTGKLNTAETMPRGVRSAGERRANSTASSQP